MEARNLCIKARREIKYIGKESHVNFRTEIYTMEHGKFNGVGINEEIVI